MPLQRRLPKRGFKSLHATFKAEVRLSDLNNLAVGDIDILVFKQAGMLECWRAMFASSCPAKSPKR